MQTERLCLLPSRQGSLPSGTPVGDRMSGGFTASQVRTSHSFEIDHVVGDQWFFVPVITNNSNDDLLMALNWGLQSETRCNCVVGRGTLNVAIGYYRFYNNSNVRGFTGQYGGAWKGWSDISTSSLEDGSGRVRLTAR